VEGKQNLRKGVEAIYSKTSIKSVASISLVEVGGLWQNPQPPEANGGLGAEA